MSSLAPEFHHIWERQIDQLFLGALADAGGLVGVMGAEVCSGASTLTRAIAERASRGGRSVLIVELDLNQLSVPAGPEDAELRFDVLSTLIPGKTKEPSRLCLPVRLPVPDWLEHPSIFRNLVAKAGDYNFTLVDVPSIDQALPGFSPLVVAKACETVLLVCASVQLTEPTLRTVADSLSAIEVPVGGVVVNDQFNPTLGAELAREAARLERFLPKFSKKLQRRALSWEFINEQV